MTDLLDYKRPKGIVWWLRIRWMWFMYRVERGAWRLGTWLREWSCVRAGGSHDYLEGQRGCVVCGHEEPRYENE